jgi:hypothetical protein
MATAKPQGSQLWSDDDLVFENETWNLHMIVTGDKRKYYHYHQASLTSPKPCKIPV